MSKITNTLLKLQTSSCSLEIEHGRITKLMSRNAFVYCMRMDDEKHFLLNCDTIAYERQCLFDKIRLRYPIFFDLDDLQKFHFPLMSEDHQILTWLAKFTFYIKKKEVVSIETLVLVCSLHYLICSLYYICMDFTFTCRLMPYSFYQHFRCK